MASGTEVSYVKIIRWQKSYIEIFIIHALQIYLHAFIIIINNYNRNNWSFIYINKLAIHECIIQFNTIFTLLLKFLPKIVSHPIAFSV